MSNRILHHHRVLLSFQVDALLKFWFDRILFRSYRTSSDEVVREMEKSFCNITVVVNEGRVLGHGT
jgi:hypothetical protein